MLLLATVPLLFSCREDGPAGPEVPEEPDDPVTLTLADPDATPETKALYSNLWAIKEKGWIFGHQNDLINGRKWRYTEGRSDTKEVCGDYPGVFAVDVASFMDGRKVPLQTLDENPVKLRTIKDAYDRGMVIMACMHLNNPLTGGDSWDHSSDQVAAEILKDGSETNVLFNSWLDNLADLAKSLKGSDGKQIPVILRPFHEHGHDWSWWGSTLHHNRRICSFVEVPGRWDEGPWGAQLHLCHLARHEREADGRRLPLPLARRRLRGLHGHGLLPGHQQHGVRKQPEAAALGVRGQDEALRRHRNRRGGL
jgi:Glycosyl hydrolase family 26.